ncbi:LacI family DNA-binding transcriptional regulator [Paenibacillus spongiae]|uniref:LacI family DNA-binding transcriptional regulator n=1 Tax=Paenibacillus spongiae TaxID=2909671 RepID=A0ABY5SGA5_9BACL|nr:LacI family DNA-binding transcriptional regulator [Paenibacillus spongiae]UVI33024.1 LacI family DNA-binding transcriptional regulator [Paenibacillus spongiae]
MKKKVTLRDLSEKLGLSTAAVSKALRGHQGVSEATRKLVFETAHAMKYRGIPEAESAAQTAPCSFIIVDRRELTEPHTMSTYFFITNAMKAHGLEVAIHGVPMDGGDRAIFDSIARENPMALFLFGRFSQKFAEELKDTGKTTVVIDYDYPALNVDVVLPNDYQGAFTAVQHLVHAGHHRIGYIGDKRLSPGFHDRHKGFIDALEYWGLEANSKHIYDMRFKDAFGNIDFSPIVTQIDYDDLPTAFFCANDPIAYILNNSLNARGFKTPDDISMVGFDNLDSSQWQYPPLTSVNYPREHIAKKAVELMLWRQDDRESPCNKILVQPALVVRQSVTTPRKKRQLSK